MENQTIWVLVEDKNKLENNNGAFNIYNEGVLKYSGKCKISIVDKNDVDVYIKDNLDLPSNLKVIVRSKLYDIMEYFEGRGVKLYNNLDATKKASDKLWCNTLVEGKGFIKIPITFKDTDYKSIVSKIGVPFIYKDNYGFKGEGVYLIKNEEDFNRVKYELGEGLTNYIAQEYIKSSYGMDVRVYVVRDKIITGIKRKASKGFKSNVSGGGEVSYEEIKIDNRIKEGIINLGKELDLSLYCVDLLIGEKDEYVFCEINTNVGFSLIKDDSKYNIPKEYIEDVLLH